MNENEMKYDDEETATWKPWVMRKPVIIPKQEPSKEKPSKEKENKSE